MAENTQEDIVDVAFRLPGGRLPVDHAYALFGEVSRALPWFADEAAARLHPVHTAGPGSGWMPPDESSGGELHLSRRTRLTVRIPERRAEAAMTLSGRSMDISGYPLTPGAAKVVPLVPAGTLLARHVVCELNEDESRFVPRLAQTLRKHGVVGATLICGRAHRIVTPDGVIHTRSLVVANLDPGGALSLMRKGIGPAGKLGCGIFIPYKRIE
ncbi:MAG TPA: type I-MYXAN CRISPR-associated protein Cas6/Cmx6 [Gammaproteobacteria bacterium]|nr:type I-MYXAN CRISPR-associated protein Cas6/Cmx6 [Gammaproteobacteria bacterium]